MTVTLNPVAIEALFVRPTVIAFLERAAQEEIVPEMQEDIRSYFVGAETGVEDDVSVGVEGGRVVAGLRDDPNNRSHRTNLRGESKSARYARVGKWEKTRDKVRGTG